MFRFLFTQSLLFLIAVAGWGLVGFGGWIAWRGVFLYALDPVLMGTGGGLAIGGLLVVAMTLAARVQVTTAKTALDILARLNAIAPAPDKPARSAPTPNATGPIMTRK